MSPFMLLYHWVISLSDIVVKEGFKLDDNQPMDSSECYTKKETLQRLHVELYQYFLLLVNMAAHHFLESKDR